MWVGQIVRTKIAGVGAGAGAGGVEIGRVVRFDRRESRVCYKGSDGGERGDLLYFLRPAPQCSYLTSF